MQSGVFPNSLPLNVVLTEICRSRYHKRLIHVHALFACLRDPRVIPVKETPMVVVMCGLKGEWSRGGDGYDDDAD